MTQQLEMFGAARAERDRALARISMSNAEWMPRALMLLATMKYEQAEATGEEIRVWLLANGLPHPTKPNAWGALTRGAAVAGLLADTGRVKQMQAKRSHARRTPVWRFL